MFSRGVASAETEVLADFRDALGSATPINAIGVLTRVEHYWSEEEPDPMAAGRRVARRLMRVPAVRRLLFSMEPVASLAGEGAETMTSDEFAWLAALAETPAETLERRVRRGPSFCARPYDDLPVPPDARRRLFERLGAWGIALSCRLLREGAVDDLDGPRARLVDRNGLGRLRELVESHFGNRALLIKLQRALAEGRALARRAGGAVDGAARDRLAEAAGELERLALNEQAFAEFEVRNHYEGRLMLTRAQADELLRVTGEHGVWVTDRLGLARTRDARRDVRAGAQPPVVLEFFGGRPRPALERQGGGGAHAAPLLRASHLPGRPAATWSWSSDAPLVRQAAAASRPARIACLGEWPQGDVDTPRLLAEHGLRPTRCPPPPG